MKTYDLEGLEELKENIDYELIPSEGENWNIRALSGEYTEAVLQFGELKVADDEEHMTFNFDVVSSPDESVTAEDDGLQQRASMILSSILTNAITIASQEKQNK